MLCCAEVVEISGQCMSKAEVMAMLTNAYVQLGSKSAVHQQHHASMM
jgi:hypothetical protein